MTTVFAFILLGSHEAYHVEADQTANRNLAQQYVDARMLINEEPLTALNFHQGIKNLAQLNPDVDIYLIGPDGSLIASSVASSDWTVSRVALAPIEAFLGSDAVLPILGDDPRYHSQQTIFSVAPVVISDCPARYLYVVLHGNQTTSAVQQVNRAYLINESLALLVSCGLLAFIATAIVIRSITRRLSNLKADMEQLETDAIAGGSGSLTLTGKARGDEIERLTTLFHGLSDRLRDQMEALRSNDEMRRSMIANISHDLRTPLTTLKAHLDTLSLKDASLEPAERKQYLATSMKQCQRLTRLVSQLLELATLDAGHLALNREPFQVAELIQDITQKFSLAASRSNVEIRAEYASNLPLVVADIGLIERVIDNLIDNALQYSPVGGTVTVRAAAVSADQVRIDIEDLGPGIAKEDQAKLFDRFYRGDQSRSTESTHTGLGLAIVKGILDLHGIPISIHSEEGHGARFSFDLPTRVAAIV